MDEHNLRAKRLAACEAKLDLAAAEIAAAAAALVELRAAIADGRTAFQWQDTMRHLECARSAVDDAHDLRGQSL